MFHSSGGIGNDSHLGEIKDKLHYWERQYENLVKRFEEHEKKTHDLIDKAWSMHEVIAALEWSEQKQQYGISLARFLLLSAKAQKVLKEYSNDNA